MKGGGSGNDSKVTIENLRTNHIFRVFLCLCAINCIDVAREREREREREKEKERERLREREQIKINAMIQLFFLFFL